MVNYSAKINSIKYLTEIFIFVVAIFFLFIVSFDLSKLYKYVFKKFQKNNKPKYVSENQNVACNNFQKTIEIDRRYLEFIKKNNKRNNCLEVN